MFVAVLSKEHSTLPAAELEAVLRAEAETFSIEQQRGEAVFFKADAIDFSRLAMTKEVSRLIASASTDELDAVAADVEDFDGTFAVRCHALDDTERSMSQYERTMGREIQQQKENEVDLENPDHLFRLYIHSNTGYLCERLQKIDRGVFEERRNHLLPFSSPVSLHPRLARALVNLAEVERGARLLDPFCGTGGILLEAAMMGIDCTGSDIDQEMVEGAKQNLEAFGLTADIDVGDVKNIADIVDDVDAIVTDPPYGRASLSTSNHEELIGTFLDEARKVCDGRIVFMSRMEAVAGHEPEFEVYVHKNLSRCIYVIDAEKDL